MTSFLLDTSALMAWMRGEPGQDRVLELLQGEEEILVPWPVLMECYYGTIKARGEYAALERHTALRELPVRLLDGIDEALYLLAGDFKVRYSISFADALIAAYAFRHNAILVHKDPEYEAIAGEVRLEALPYKMAKAE